MPDAMPNATIGHRTVVLTAFLHYFVGATISQIVEIFNTPYFSKHSYFKLTPGGLVHLWKNPAAVLLSWYEQIREDARNSDVLHGDDWNVFSKRLKRIVRDAMRLRGRKRDVDSDRYGRLCNGIENRLSRLIKAEWKNVEARRLVKRLRRHRKELLVFLYHDGVPFDNDHAERTLYSINTAQRGGDA